MLKASATSSHAATADDEVNLALADLLSSRRPPQV
jgi:hypothetical protein